VLKVTINLSLSTAELCTVPYYGTSSGLSAAALDMVLFYGTSACLECCVTLWYCVMVYTCLSECSIT